MSCKSPIKTKFKSQAVCNQACFTQWEIEDSKIRFPNGVECLECGLRRNDIKLHVKNIHNLSVEQYRSKHGNVLMISPKTKGIYSEQWSGENNPGFAHGGKLSPFSKKNSNYNKEWHRQRRAEHSEFMKNDNNHFRRDFYETEVDYLAHQKKNLDFFIRKYGEKVGRAKHLAKTEKWLSSYKKTNYSKVSQEIFNALPRSLFKDVYYATYPRPEKEGFVNKEYILFVGDSYVKPDFIDLATKKVIEFDGDYWHSEQIANPEREARRTKMILELGYEIFRIKEHDYKKNKDKVIEECINFLTS